jgi:CubicO group peptidase (beta-lactamase class C family)
MATLKSQHWIHRRLMDIALLATTCRPCFVGLILAAMMALPAVAEDKAGPLAAKLQPFVDRRSLAGAVVLVTDQEKVLDLECVGFADIEAKRPMTPETMFWIASMTKPITATALMILVDEGKISIDDPIAKHLPEFKNSWVVVEQDDAHVLLKRPKRPLTVRDVLNHTCGLPFKSPNEEPTLDLIPLRELVRSYALLPLQSEPGTKFVYSNVGINIAGGLIEVVSGMPYEKFLQERLLDPLEMRDTTFIPTEEQMSRMALLYQRGKAEGELQVTRTGFLHYPFTDKERQPMPAGGLFSTANDMGNLCRMMLAGGTFKGRRIVSEEAIRTMTSRQTAPEVPANWGLGWIAGPVYGHGGALSTQMDIDPQRRIATIYLVQHAGYGTEDGKTILPIFTETARQLYGKPAPQLAP